MTTDELAIARLKRIYTLRTQEQQQAWKLLEDAKDFLKDAQRVYNTSDDLVRSARSDWLKASGKT